MPRLEDLLSECFANLGKHSQQHQEVSKTGLGQLKAAEAKLFINPETQRAFFKARSDPFALSQKVDAELDKLQKLGITPVQFSDWLHQSCQLSRVMDQSEFVVICTN